MFAGTRHYRETAPEDEHHIRTYGARILSILEAPWPLAGGRVNELEPRALIIDQGAATAWRRFHDHVESQCGRESDLSGIQDFAAKAAEHAARIAGVLTIVADLSATTIDVQEMADAVTLVDWYVNETLRLQSAAGTSPVLLRAKILLDWLHGREEPLVEFRDALRLGPLAIRIKAVAEEAFAILKSHRWVDELPDRPRRFRVNQPEAVR